LRRYGKLCDVAWEKKNTHICIDDQTCGANLQTAGVEQALRRDMSPQQDTVDGDVNEAHEEADETHDCKSNRGRGRYLNEFCVARDECKQS
jgi:hypothetical protein